LYSNSEIFGNQLIFVSGESSLPWRYSSHGCHGLLRPIFGQGDPEQIFRGGRRGWQGEEENKRRR
jgi:hypothetical protein